ncbi:hypothetical protein DS745_12995 [Anaerobacillus alkaliphilus]|uniref:Uncharacterized protein n=1 Tax=Anaerobacillus alkaliphilus TaxID=1548597 RepID=A0A4Q0VR14_9BACI|nr:hypothetical protein [Anaerobacillus alkaliphilus]RXI99799.1 hypothetical protein DS745_12995 [Anaerobacillus alkaliphilus]
MKKTTLQDLLKLLGLQSDKKLKSLLQSILEDEVSEVNFRSLGFGDQLNLQSLLPINRSENLLDLRLPTLVDAETLRCLLKKIEAKIEALIEKILCLLKQLQKQRKNSSNLDPLALRDLKRRLLKFILNLINLTQIKDLLERLDGNN